MMGAGLALRTLLPGFLAQSAASQVPLPVTHRIRPGDVLEVTVAGRADLSRLRTVQPTGEIWMPRLLAVRVAGLVPAEVEARLADMLARQERIRLAVSVRLVEDQAFVRVGGAVRKPGRLKLSARRRLLDVLLEAGGFTAQASGEVIVERHDGTFADGTATRRFLFPRGTSTPDVLAGAETVLVDGDVVTAVAATTPSREEKP
jgi:protein involved in polysaccharide export with SLBB domain